LIDSFLTGGDIAGGMDRQGDQANGTQDGNDDDQDARIHFSNAFRAHGKWIQGIREFEWPLWQGFSPGSGGSNDLLFLASPTC
jgi:hypothetical protein